MQRTKLPEPDGEVFWRLSNLVSILKNVFLQEMKYAGGVFPLQAAHCSAELQLGKSVVQGGVW